MCIQCIVCTFIGTWRPEIIQLTYYVQSGSLTGTKNTLNQFEWLVSESPQISLSLPPHAWYYRQCTTFSYIGSRDPNQTLTLGTASTLCMKPSPLACPVTTRSDSTVLRLLDDPPLSVEALSMALGTASHFSQGSATTSSFQEDSLT